MFEIKVFTLYPDLYPGPSNIGIYKKLGTKRFGVLKVINMRDYANDKHSSVDDTPFGWKWNVIKARCSCSST